MQIASAEAGTMTNPIEQIIEGVEQRVAERYVHSDYTDSYIAFLDVLGMQELVKRPYSELRTLFNAAEAGRALYSQMQVAGGNRFIGRDHLKMTVMSDALVLSIDSGIDRAFAKVVGFSSYLINRLLKALETPVFLRGGITRGLIFQDSQTVFGPGLVAAYRLETDVAKSMRCIVSPDLDDDPGVQEYLERTHSALVIDPDDGVHFLDFCRPDIRDRLATRVTEILKSDAPESLKRKFKWLDRYINGWTDP